MIRGQALPLRVPSTGSGQEREELKKIIVLIVLAPLLACEEGLIPRPRDGVVSSASRECLTSTTCGPHGIVLHSSKSEAGRWSLPIKSKGTEPRRTRPPAYVLYNPASAAVSGSANNSKPVALPSLSQSMIAPRIQTSSCATVNLRGMPSRKRPRTGSTSRPRTDW